MSANESIAEILQRHFEMRRNTNPRYSLRAYSRDLNLSPGFLSQVLSDKRGLSLEKTKDIAKRLKLNKSETRYFISKSLATFSRSKTEKTRASAVAKKESTEYYAFKLNSDSFKLIADWHHLAIFQSLFLPDHTKNCALKGEVNFLSRFLKISPDETQSALEWLQKLKIIKPFGKIHVPLTDTIRVKNKLPSSALRRFHSQIIQKSLIAMEAQPIHERFFNTTTLTVSKADMPKIMTEYEQFYKSIVQRYTKKPTAEIPADSIYALSTQFFNLSHLGETL